MQVTIINGAGGCGKDTFIKYFTEEAGEKYVSNISTIDCIKKVAREWGWNGQKDDESRKYLSLMKEAAIYWGDIPYKQMLKEIRYFYSYLANFDVDDHGFVFIHCREPQEIQRLKEGIEFPTHTLLIRRAGHKIYGNHSDDDVENYKYDYIFTNNGTLEDLARGAKNYYERIKQA